MIIKNESGNVIYHHGIKGQKWGVRRFQNYDGTLIKRGSAIRRKTKYTNIDGSLNEQGKIHSQKYINKQLKKNEKYYNKYIKKYEKMADKFKDNKELAEKFHYMKTDAIRSKESVSKSIREMGIDEIMQNERENKIKVAKVLGVGLAAAGIGGLTAAGLATAAGACGSAVVGAGQVAKNLVNDPNQTMRQAENYLMTNKYAKQAVGLAEQGIRTYADVRGFTVGIYADEVLNRMDKMGVTDRISNTVSGTISKTANQASAGMNAQTANLIKNINTNLFSDVNVNPNLVNNVNANASSASAALAQIAQDPRYYEMLRQFK